MPPQASLTPTVEQCMSQALLTTEQFSLSKVCEIYYSNPVVSNHLYKGTGVLVNSGQEGVNWRVQSSYTIDGGSPTVYSNNTMQSSTEAFRSPTLPNGQHTLTVINLDSRGVSLFLDSFIVFTDSGTGSGSTSSPSNPTTSSTSTATTPVTDSSSHASSSGPTASTSTAVHLPAVTMASSSTIPHNASIPTSSAATKSNDSSQIPLIVGPIFGAIFFCGILYSLVLLRRRRKRKELNEPIATPSKSFAIFLENFLWFMDVFSFLCTNSIVGPYASKGGAEAVSLPQLKRTSSVYRGLPSFLAFNYCG